MRNKRRYKYSIEGRPLYPHIKLTRERFPRLLSTRIIHDDDDAEYFGPFLNRSAARILIDLLNRTFRLRTCTIDVDGSFPFPCTQYYANRCVAPCVSSLCGPEEYSKLVDLSRLFLRNDRDEFEFSVNALIDAAAGELRFEGAAFYRDILTRARKFWADPRARVWLNDAIDTFVVEIESDTATVYLITTRGPRPLGSRAFQFMVFEETDIREVLSDTIRQVYAAGVPREIRIPFDIPDRKELARELIDRFGRAVKITVKGKMPERVAALKGLARMKFETELQSLKPVVTTARLVKQLARAFDLEKPQAVSRRLIQLTFQEVIRPPEGRPGTTAASRSKNIEKHCRIALVNSRRFGTSFAIVSRILTARARTLSLSTEVKLRSMLR